MINREIANLGRPEIQIDMDELGVFCRMKPTLRECAEFFKCSEDTIERRIKEAFGVTFAEFRDQNMTHTRFSLIRKAIRKAEDGDNTMLIFCLKNLCGWRDRPSGDGDKIIMDSRLTSMSDFDLDERIRALKQELKVNSDL